MANTTYTYTSAYKFRQIATEIKASSLSDRFLGLSESAPDGDSPMDTLKVTFSEALDAADKTILDNLVSGHVPEPDPSTLEQVKLDACAAVDRRTGELIAAGFTYDSTLFSLSEVAQINWVGLKVSDQNAMITYPFGVTTKDDSEYLIQNTSDLSDFFIAGVGVKIGHLQTGRALKVSIKAAVDEAAVAAVVDNR